MGFVNDTFEGAGLGAATPGTLTSVFDPGDLLGTDRAARAGEASREAQEAQEAALLRAEEETRRSRAEGQAFLEPFGSLGVSGVDQASFLTDTQAQFDFLQSNPLFKASLENANRSTQQQAASRGRSSFGTTQQDLTNNVLLSASPLIGEQKRSINDLLNVGTGIARSQANTAIGEGSEISGLIQDRGNVQSTGIVGRNQIIADTTQNQNQLAGQALSFFSDPRLKANKKQIGESNGFALWSWDWNELGAKLGLFGSSTGVMADEVCRKMPEAISIDRGFMRVNYAMAGVKHGY